jgi:hypothetical protein
MALEQARGEPEGLVMLLESDFTHRGRHEWLPALFSDQRSHFFRAAAFERENPETVEGHA